MPPPEALVDSNVVIAMVAHEHQHHAASVALVPEGKRMRLAVAAHSYAEAYTTLTTRSSRAPFRWSPEQAWETLESVAKVTTLVGLFRGADVRRDPRLRPGRRRGSAPL